MMYDNLMSLTEDSGDLAVGVAIGLGAGDSNSVFRERMAKLKKLIKAHAPKFKIQLTSHKIITFKNLDLRDSTIDDYALFDVVYSTKTKDTIHANLKSLCATVNNEATTIMNDISIHDNVKDNRFVIVYSFDPVSRAWMKSHT